ncbi:FUSC family protein [Pseudooceanicola marinus]|uniref:FUSC family protein n=1 Tax=Pseudooceanicola marinus TaxID=396013 RepID=UPI001CD7DA15|nr:FUSC family protein [Pseudooceanicola marinus]MCA1336348.1 FUSC family protein [Pseudooceanicola marinus]
MHDLLTRLGFDAPRTLFSARTAVAVCIAFLLAWGLGLEHPQWAGMTVWAAAQPLRGQLLEKSLFRLLGTISGTAVGILLVLGMQVHPAILVAGLAAWVGACTAIGNLQRGFVAYATVLAGYTAAMVALLDTGHPDQVLALGADRLATVLTGVLTASLVGLLWTPAANGADLRATIAELLADLLEHVAQGRRAAHGASEADAALLARIAALDDALEPHGAGHPRARARTRAARSLLLSAMSLLFTGPAVPRPATAAALSKAAQALRHGNAGRAAQALTPGLQALPPEAEAHANLTALQAALSGWATAPDAAVPDGDAAAGYPVIPHRDRPGATQAGLRAGGTLLLFGLLWMLTGWTALGYMLLGLSVMTSLFSTFENPAGMMRFVFLGQCLGVLGALVIRWLVWPWAGTELQQVLMVLPFILLGPLLVGHRRTVAVAFDYNMVMLLLLHPGLPLTGSFGASLASGAAVVAAPLAAFGAYRWVFPASARRRSAALIRAMLEDIAAIAAAPGAVARPLHWRARMYHRLLRLLRLTQHSAPLRAEALASAEALMELGRAVTLCHRLMADEGLDPGARRAVSLALARSRALVQRPERVAGAYDRLARRLGGETGALMARTARALQALPIPDGGPDRRTA